MRLKLALRVPTGAQFGATGARTYRQNDRYYAVAVNERGRPQVFDYADDDDGRDGLMNLLRADTVLAVIYGQRLDFRLTSVAQITVNGQSFESVLPVTRT